MKLTPILKKGLGRKVDSRDDRDHTVKVFGLRGGYGSSIASIAPLPSSANVFTGLNLPVYDQGQLGSCTANAGVLYRRFLAQKFPEYSAKDEDLSRLFLYYQERVLSGDVTEDAGSSVRTTFKVLNTLGVCPESDDPYNQQLFADASINNSAKDLDDASHYKLVAYKKIPDLSSVKGVLASGYAIELGFNVYESFEYIDSSGIMPVPKSNEQLLGGHAVVIYGYDDQKLWFIVRNSWGSTWGNKGDFYMPYSYLNSTMSQSDMWMGHF